VEGATVSTLREALEQALFEDPDDLAAHSAYADYLTDQGDPRGEFISVQLALEDESKPAAERERLRRREADLLAAHERDWLGELAPFLFPEDGGSDWRSNPDKPDHARWARGWLDEVYFWWFDLDIARALAGAPVARLLRRLHIEHCGSENSYEARPEDGIPVASEYPNLYPLQKAAFLPHLHFFQLGESVDFEEQVYNSEACARGVTKLLAQMTRLEELHLFAYAVDMRRLFALPNLANLRTLILYHGHEEHPLELLAGNPALGRLATLRIHPAHGDEGSHLPREKVCALLESPHLPSLTHLHLHASDLGDAGCADIVRSGILRRLKVLDLRHGCIQDEGARTLASCPDLKRLELLSLADNELTEEGQAVLSGLGIPVRCEGQHEPGSDEYLWSGDME
jgi:uncharacterized protein (TIGR02996 family)